MNNDRLKPLSIAARLSSTNTTVSTIELAILIPFFSDLFCSSFHAELNLITDRIMKQTQSSGGNSIIDYKQKEKGKQY